MIVTLAGVALLASMGIPTFFSRAEVTLDNAAVLLARDLRAAQNRAAFLHSVAVFEFLPDGEGYRVTTRQGWLVRHPEADEMFERHYAGSGVFEGVEVASIEFGGDNAIVFDERGRPSRGGDVTLTFGDERRVVRLLPRTGRIQVFGLQRRWFDQ